MRVVILEDDPIIALDLQMTVESLGHEVVEVCRKIADLTRCAPNRFDFALLDVDLPDGKSFDVAGHLDRQQVRFAFVSGSRRADLPAHFRHVPFIAKPFGPAALRDFLHAA